MALQQYQVPVGEDFPCLYTRLYCWHITPIPSGHGLNQGQPLSVTAGRRVCFCRMGLHAPHKSHDIHGVFHWQHTDTHANTWSHVTTTRWSVLITLQIMCSLSAVVYLIWTPSHSSFMLSGHTTWHGTLRGHRHWPLITAWLCDNAYSFHSSSHSPRIPCLVLCLLCLPLLYCVVGLTELVLVWLKS
jgi:hypothetical protein